MTFWFMLGLMEAVQVLGYCFTPDEQREAAHTAAGVYDQSTHAQAGEHPLLGCTIWDPLRMHARAAGQILHALQFVSSSAALSTRVLPLAAEEAQREGARARAAQRLGAADAKGACQTPFQHL